MTWKRRSRNEDIALHRVEMNMERWKLCKNLDQGVILVSHVREKEKIMKYLCDKIITA